MAALFNSHCAFLQQSARAIQRAAVGRHAGNGHRNGWASRLLTFEHLHTNEHLSLVYAVGDAVLPQAQTRLDHFLARPLHGRCGRD